MKNSLTISLLFVAATCIGFAATHTITNSSFAFTPSTISIVAGDTVNFVLETIHNAREVSLATWNANGTTSNGGFDLPFGGGTVVLTQVGIHYYVCVPHASLGMKGTITVTPATGVKTVSNQTPANFRLLQNYPNPFNPRTIISFTHPSHAFVSLKIFNVLGGEVATLLAGDLPAGSYSVQWNAASSPSGVYFYRLQDGILTETKKLILMK